MKYLIALLLAISYSVPASAEESAYMVAGIMQTPGTTVVKLMQGIQVASSPEQAVEIFRSHSMQAHPGFVMIDTLVSKVVLPVKRADCGVSI